ncbi:MAG: tyrosine-type recombinase/integrase [Terriglobales bacterium]
MSAKGELIATQFAYIRAERGGPSTLIPVAALAQMSVVDACENWLESRKYHIAPRTFESYHHHIRTVSPFFSGLLISDLDGDHLRRYQHERAKHAAPDTINKELGVIIQVRKRINRPIEDYQRLQQAKDYESPGRALTPPEEVSLERTCKLFSKHKSWDAAALCLLLAMRTGMTRCEILSLKLKDVDLDSDPAQLIIPRRGAKRVSRERRLVLLGDALWAMQKLVERCRKCGGIAPDHFLVPFRVSRDHYDPVRPAKHYREAAEHIFSIAGIENFWPNFCRHHAVSKGLRNPKMSLAMANEQFGWVNPKMQKRYYHGSLDNLIAMARVLDEQPVKKSPSKVPSQLTSPHARRIALVKA